MRILREIVSASAKTCWTLVEKICTSTKVWKLTKEILRGNKLKNYFGSK